MDKDTHVIAIVRITHTHQRFYGPERRISADERMHQEKQLNTVAHYFP